MKIEIIKEFGINDLQNKINDFISDKDNIVSCNLSAHVMHDYYENTNSQICNQWFEYIAVIIYN